MSARRIRVLAIDDDVQFLKMLERSFGRMSEAHQFQLVPCTSIVGAAASDPDIVLLDLNLGESGTGGLRSLEKAQAAWPGTQIIVLTGQEPNGLYDALIRAGAFDALHKSTVDSIKGFESLLHILHAAFSKSGNAKAMMAVGTSLVTFKWRKTWKQVTAAVSIVTTLVVGTTSFVTWMVAHSLIIAPWDLETKESAKKKYQTIEAAAVVDKRLSAIEDSSAEVVGEVQNVQQNLYLLMGRMQVQPVQAPAKKKARKQ